MLIKIVLIVAAMAFAVAYLGGFIVPAKKGGEVFIVVVFDCFFLLALLIGGAL